MTRFAIAILAPMLLSVAVGVRPSGTAAPPSERTHAERSPGDAEVIRKYCVRCHGKRVQKGNLQLTTFDPSTPQTNAAVAEKIILKLRAGMMPPPGAKRPSAAVLAALAESLENRIDAVAAADPNPGSRSFQRLNRAEYENSIRDLLDLDINAGDDLPLDTKSANFDNIADTQHLSPTLLTAYLNAAARVSRLAVGDAHATPTSKTYTNPGYVSQWGRVKGAPRGTRGGISVVHNFVADGKYSLRLAFEHTTTGGFFGGTTRGEKMEISVDGRRVALLDVDRFMNVSDPNGVNMDTEPIAITAGPHRVTAAFLRQTEGPVEDLLSPHDWSLVDRQIGVSGYGITALAHLKDMVIRGPFEPTGVSRTPSRDRIFGSIDVPAVPPIPAARRRELAQDILDRLGARAFRRPLTTEERSALLGFYDVGCEQRGYEFGIRMGLQAILASPDFVFRFEGPADPAAVRPGANYRISNLALAARLSFFLWSAPPDDELRGAALHTDAELTKQVHRMLQDPRATALATRFAGQWLRLQDLDKVHPDRLLYPDFHQQLAAAMRRETELFFLDLVRRDRSILELIRADYTFVNQRLARHYGRRDVAGTRFRRVRSTDENRRGILGHGSILTLTSHANRTSPVLRGKWIMDVLLGAPPPNPPPDVPELDETKGDAEGRFLSTRERLAEHAKNRTCHACHRLMDPIGLALDNFDVTGRWRIRENGVRVDPRGELYDGTALASPADLHKAILDRRVLLFRSFTQNLLAYALGRRVEPFDMPTVRAIVDAAAENDHRISAFILGVVRSPAFRMRRAPSAARKKENAK